MWKCGTYSRETGEREGERARAKEPHKRGSTVTHGEREGGETGEESQREREKQKGSNVEAEGETPPQAAKISGKPDQIQEGS